MKYHDVVIVCGERNDDFPMHEITANLDEGGDSGRDRGSCECTALAANHETRPELLQRAFASLTHATPSAGKSVSR